MKLTQRIPVLRAAIGLLTLLQCDTLLPQELPRQRFDDLRIDYPENNGEPPIEIGSEFYAYLTNMAARVDGKNVIVRELIFASAGAGRNGSSTMPRLKKREIFPMFGSLYRVVHLGLQVRRIPDDEVPDGVGVNPSGIVAPVQRDGVGQGSLRYESVDGKWGHARLTVVSIQHGKADEAGAVAIVRSGAFRGPNEQSVRVGDKLRFGRDKWIVQNIVPRNEMTKVIGWVEIVPFTRPQIPAVAVFGEGTLTLRAGDPKEVQKQADGSMVPAIWISEWYDHDRMRMPGLWVAESRLTYKTFESSLLPPPRGIKLDYPALREGDVLPLLGRLYRVRTINWDSIKFDEIDSDDEMAHLAPDPKSLVIPARPETGIYGYKEDPPLSGNRWAHLFIRGFYRSGMAAYTVPAHGTRKIWTLSYDHELDDIFRGYKIERVVRPDKNRQIIGWVELKRVNDEDSSD